MQKVIKASGNEVEPYWPMLFAKALKSAKIEDLLSNVASAAPAGGAAAAGPAAGGAAAVEEVQEVKKEEAEAVDMGGLFGDDDGY